MSEDICKPLDKPISPHTVTCELKRSGYGHWKAPKKKKKGLVETRKPLNCPTITLVRSQKGSLFLT